MPFRYARGNHYPQFNPQPDLVRPGTHRECHSNWHYRVHGRAVAACYHYLEGEETTRLFHDQCPTRSSLKAVQMTDIHDIFLRAHTVVPNKKSCSQRESPWPDCILVYDCETLTDATLKLTFGVYKICKLVNDRYLCEEEGLFYADDLPEWQRKIIGEHVRAEDVYADIEAKSFTPKIRLRLRPRSEFVKSVFFKAILDKTMIVGFNLPFDLARIAEEWGEADDGGHSLILCRWHDPKTGQLEEDTYYPRIVYKALNSKTALIHSTQVRKPPKDGADKDKEAKVIFWPHGRFMDVRTLLWALRNKSYSLKSACKKLKTATQKMEHTPTGDVTPEEIEYCRRDVKCTVRSPGKNCSLLPIERIAT